MMLKYCLSSSLLVYGAFSWIQEKSHFSNDITIYLWQYPWWAACNGNHSLAWHQCSCSIFVGWRITRPIYRNQESMPCHTLLEGLNTLHYFGHKVTSSPKWNFLGLQIIPLSAHNFMYHIVVQNSFLSESSNTSVSSIISLLFLISFVISYFCFV